MYRLFLAAMTLALAIPVSAVSLAADYELKEALVEKYATTPTDIDSKGSPYSLVQSLGEQVFAAVASAKGEDAEIEALMQVIVERQLMPFIDVKFASYKILGTQLKKSQKDERALFVDAMKQNLISTYSSALSQYDNQSIIYEPAREVGNKKTVTVKAELVATGAPTIDMIFKLRKNKKTGEWKAYDLVVEGISLVDAKRAELSKPLRQNGIRYVAENLLN